jgi:2-hydroxychromene-2-carboxylate isomerase
VAAPIDFYFDFTSPYGYLAAEHIDALAAKYDRQVNWHAILLGFIFKRTGQVAPMDVPLKGEYVIHDMLRSARYLGIPINFPTEFPKMTIAAARGFYWLQDQDPALAKKFAEQVYRAYFVDNRDVSNADVIADIAQNVGVDRAAFVSNVQSDPVKERFKNESDGAIARKVFGSPYFIVDNEPFWGADRMEQLERWLKTGGF